MSWIRTLAPVALGLALSSTACGPHWPNQPTIVGDRGFMERTRTVATVDVLPLDLEVWAAPGYDANPDQMRSTAEAQILNTAIATLAERRYTTAAMIDWDGNAGDNVAVLAESDLVATIGALASYGAAAARSPGQTPIPYLPARLGETTHSDATLFVGGWAFIGNHEDGTATKVAKGIAIGLVVVAVVVVVAIAAASLGKDHRGGGRHGDDHGGGVIAAAGRGVVRLGARVASEAAVTMVDAFGRAAVFAAATDWSEDPALPHAGDSQMYLEMTLVDNHTGLVLWHAHQQFPADASHSEDVDRVAHVMLSSLPAR